MRVMFYLDSVENGGIGRVVVNLANLFASRGISVYVLSNLNNCSFAFSQEVVLLDRPKNVSRIREVFFTRNLIKQYKPNVIIGITHFFLWAYLASWGLKIPVIASDHASYEYQPTLLSKFFRFYIYRLATATTILTECDKRILGKRLPQKRVVPNPVEIPKYVIPIRERQNVILVAGRLDDWKIKGLDLLISAWGSIASQYPNWVLKVAGSGTSENLLSLNNFAQEAGLKEGQIQFVGFIVDIQ